jgi:nucleoside-diphosphate-sugar epimerase
MTIAERRPRVLLTGGAGFLGTLLAERLLSDDSVRFDGFGSPGIEALTVVDIAPPRSSVADDERVRAITGTIEDALPEVGRIDVVLHLAGVVSGAAEADFDLGMRTNLDGTRHLLNWARTLDAPPLFLFASSLAVFGSDPAIGPIGEVDDDTLPRPQSSYGIQKFIGEQLVADHDRKGFVRGRSVRFMTVAIRPGRPNAAASSFVSGIIREPLAGIPATCPVPPETPIALSSPRRTIEGILTAVATDAMRWGSRTALTLPALTTTPRAMVAAMDRVAGGTPSRLVEWTEDPVIAEIVGSWPSRLRTDRAAALGLSAEPTFDGIVAQYLADRDAVDR